VGGGCKRSVSSGLSAFSPFLLDYNDLPLVILKRSCSRASGGRLLKRSCARRCWNWTSAYGSSCGARTGQAGKRRHARKAAGRCTWDRLSSFQRCCIWLLLRRACRGSCQRSATRSQLREIGSTIWCIQQVFRFAVKHAASLELRKYLVVHTLGGETSNLA
jgi:hypothetical protein